MAIKNELILSYIKELAPGTKISVRKLAEQLDVSEGTVYKAIKLAEAQGLVVTKPKAGTFRVETGFAAKSEPVSLKRLVKLLGLTTVVEPADYDRVIERIVICDGSEAQLRAALDASPPGTHPCCASSARGRICRRSRWSWGKPAGDRRRVRRRAHAHRGGARGAERAELLAGHVHDTAPHG